VLGFDQSRGARKAPPLRPAPPDRPRNAWPASPTAACSWRSKPNGRTARPSSCSSRSGGRIAGAPEIRRKKADALPVVPRGVVAAARV